MVMPFGRGASFSPSMPSARRCSSVLNTTNARSDRLGHGGNDTVAEVAAIVNHDDRVNLPNVAAPSGDSDAQGRRFVSQYSTLYDTLRYVLFFPTGVGGWGQRGLGRSAQRPLSTAGHPFTCGGYARAAIYQKEVLSLLPRLTQEYTLDEFSRRESIGVLSYARSDPGGTFTRTRNRATARRVARRDAAIEAGVAGAADRTIGRPRVYLPASLPGSPKHQQMLVDDGLAVIEKYGKPTYVCQCVLNLTHVSQSMCTLQLLHYVHVQSKVARSRCASTANCRLCGHTMPRFQSAAEVVPETASCWTVLRRSQRAVSWRATCVHHVRCGVSKARVSACTFSSQDAC